MPIDKDTLSYYNTHAETYAAQRLGEQTQDRLEEFADRLPSGGRVLELGSGGGHAISAFQALGFDVTAVDASAELAKIASERTGIQVRVLDFDQLDYDEEFDGLWANASLLHVPTDRREDVLRRVTRCLKLDGYLYASFKESEDDWTDKLGRRFGAMTEDLICTQLEGSGQTIETVEQWDGPTTEDTQTSWIAAAAYRHY